MIWPKKFGNPRNLIWSFDSCILSRFFRLIACTEFLRRKFPKTGLANGILKNLTRSFRVRSYPISYSASAVLLLLQIAPFLGPEIANLVTAKRDAEKEEFFMQMIMKSQQKIGNKEKQGRNTSAQWRRYRF